jgi:hypothetical protein
VTVEDVEGVQQLAHMGGNFFTFRPFNMVRYCLIHHYDDNIFIEAIRLREQIESTLAPAILCERSKLLAAICFCDELVVRCFV